MALGFNLIERYVFGRAFMATMITLASLAGVVWIVNALRKLDVITSQGAAIIAYLQITTLAVPMLILAVIPIALLVAVIFTVNALNANSELVVINASGASNWVIVKPLIVLSLICTLFVGFIGHFVIAWSLLELKHKVREVQADLVSVIIQEGTFTKVKDKITFHIAKRDAGGLLRGIVISDERDEKSSILFTAKRGIVSRVGDSAVLYLKDGEIQQYKHADNSVSIIRYQSYAFDLSTFTAKMGAIKLRPKERTTWELLHPDVNDPFYQKSPGLYRATIHERFSEMLWPVTYVLVVLAFAGQARSTRQSYGSAIFWAVTFLIVLRGFAFSGVSSLKSDPNAVYVVYALPLIGMMFGGWFVVRNEPVSMPKSWSAYLGDKQLLLSNWMEQVKIRYISYRRRSAGVQS